MHKYKLVIAYDGTEYYGWQEQREQATVSGVIQATFKKVFGRDCSMIAASRTDAGVHALGQVARITTDLDIDSATMQRALNAVLPSAIHIRSLSLAQDDFHPLYGVAYKIYYYHIFTSRPLPQWARYGYKCHTSFNPARHPEQPKCHPSLPAEASREGWELVSGSSFNLEKFKQCLTVFAGTHDFRSFCTGYDKVSTVRTIDFIDCVYDKHLCAYRVIIKGPGFLRYMIRRIVGAALHVSASPALTPALLQRVLEEKNPLQQLPTAPAHGLLLRKVVYK